MSDKGSFHDDASEAARENPPWVVAEIHRAIAVDLGCEDERRLYEEGDLVGLYVLLVRKLGPGAFCDTLVDVEPRMVVE
jgi:hypothetical protein